MTVGFCLRKDTDTLQTELSRISQTTEFLKIISTQIMGNPQEKQ